jgi:hypothetical protein
MRLVKPISEFISLMKQGVVMPCQLVVYLQRGLGEPLSSKLHQQVASFIQVYLDDDESELLLQVQQVMVLKRKPSS